MMNKTLNALALLTLTMGLVASGTTQAALRVLACEPEWEALTTAIGGDLVSVSSAVGPRQDPHRIEARPSLIARVRNADLLFCTGLDLEVGWLPVLLRQSNNPRIQPGRPGYLEAGRLVPVLELPQRLDRAEGDVHAYGNPHIQMDPRNIARVASGLAATLSELDPAHASAYQAGLDDFQQRWSVALARWQQRGTPLAGTPVIAHHKDMVYLINWLGMRELGNLEPKPGLDPSSAHLAQLLAGQQREPAAMVLRTQYQSDRASSWFADKASIPAVMVPTTVGGSNAARDLFSWFDDILDHLLGAQR